MILLYGCRGDVKIKKKKMFQKLFNTIFNSFFYNNEQHYHGYYITLAWKYNFFMSRTKAVSTKYVFFLFSCLFVTLNSPLMTRRFFLNEKKIKASSTLWLFKFYAIL